MNKLDIDERGKRMKPGDTVKRFIINQISGFRQYSSLVKLIEPVGTVPNFWRFEILTGQFKGHIIKDFIYTEDQDEQPILRIVEKAKG